jgi:hypothetical protein
MNNNKNNVFLKSCLNGDLNLLKKLFEKFNKNDIENIRDESKAR